MNEAPWFRELQEEAQVQTQREALLRVLRFRFTTIAGELEQRLRDVTKLKAMQRLYDLVFECKDLEGFEEALGKVLAPRPASTRGKRRSHKPST
jgi:hypothetical protein